MRIVGHLLNASDPAKNDVFDGYNVEVSYPVLTTRGEKSTYEQVAQSFVLRDKDNSFSFMLPEAYELALDRDLEIHVVNRSGLEVAKEALLLAILARQERPIELRISNIVQPPVVTPLRLRGRLVWRADSNRTDGFAGFKVIASFNARNPESPGVINSPRAAVADIITGNAFEITLPSRELMDDGLVSVEAKYPDGKTAAIASFTQTQLREPVVIEVDAQQGIVVKTDTRVAEVMQEKVKGKVVDLHGSVQVGNKQVIVWAKNVAGAPHAALVAVTDAYGNFSGDRPKERFADAFATVAGTLNATPEQALPVDLVEVSDGPPIGGRLPKFIYLVVSLPAASEGEEVCTCEIRTPRLPDPDDLVNSPGTYSQDIGLNCVNLTTPNRTLEEFTYTLVVRTTDPEIKGTTLSDIDRRSAAERELHARTIQVKGAKQVAAPGKPIAAAAKYVTLPDFRDAYKVVPGRGPLNASNSVDWDSTPTFYQATTIAHGHILNYKQIWKADGYSLGDLLYSLPLAPGQKKQVVIFDWDRTEYGRRDEDKHEEEALSAYLSQNRDVMDIVKSSLAEHMKGGSHSETEGSAGGFGGGIGAMLGPVMVGVAGGFSSSSGSADSSAWQDSSRNVAASGLNQLRDMVQQGASAVRSQRSTVVQTARQTERFKVETEVVANHNHCHAITMQYFEVLRHYAIEQKLTHVQECLFIPLLMSEFDIRKIVRWQDILRACLLLPPRRGPLRLFGAHPLIRGIDAAERIAASYEGSDFPTGTYASEGIQSLSGEMTLTFQLNRPLDDDDKKDDAAVLDQFISVSGLNGAGWAIWWPYLGNAAAVHAKYFANQKVRYKNQIFEERVAPDIAAKLVNELKFTAVSATGGRFPLKVDTTLVSNYQRDVQLYVSVRPDGAPSVRRDQVHYVEIATETDLSASERSKIIVNEVTLRYSTPHMDGYLARNYRADNDLTPGDTVTIYTPLSTDEKRDPRKEDIQFSNMLIEHLNAHLEYYHKAIWQRMDADRRYMLLDGFVAPNAGGKSVASVVENRVIGIAGNSLIMPVAPGYKLDPTYEFKPLLDEEGFPQRDENGNILYERVSLLDHYQPVTPIPLFRVSVPTRGVFCEAIMGACNACEKKDETRFWRWEESPNPDEPTAIATVQTNPPTRTDQDLKSEPFPTPMINIQNAPAAPNPGATIAGAMDILGSSSLFPNITGLDQTQKNALQAMLSNQEAAKHFTDKAVELAKQSSNLRSGNSTVESIKKSMDDGTLDKETGKALVADVYRAQIGGKTKGEEPTSSAAQSELGKAAAEAVRGGRDVKASQTHPDGTQTQIAQKGGAGAVDLSSAATIGLEQPDPATPGKWLPVALGEGPGMAQFDGAFSDTGTVEADFPGKDSGRFRVVLTDPAFNTSSVEQVKWNTVYENGQSYEAGGATSLDLKPDPADPLRRVSQPLVIVADAEDLPIANSVGSGKNARLGGMFGRIVVERGGKKYEGPILARAKHWLLPVHIFVVKRSSASSTVPIPAWEPATLNTQLRGMQQILEPHGIFVNSQPYTFSAAQTTKFSPMERTTGNEVVYRYYEIDVPASEIATLPNISLEDVYDLGAAFAPNAGGPVLRLFFVPGFDSPDRKATSINQSRIDSLTTMDAAKKAAILNSVYIGPASRGAAVHELGHTLMDKGHFMSDNRMMPPTDPYYVHHYKAPARSGYPESHNLMRPRENATMRRIWLIPDGDGYNWKEAINTNHAKLLVRP